MVQSFALVDSPSLGDLKVFLGRAARLDHGSVRLIGGSGVLAVYTPVLYPKGLLDNTPTVLGLRTFALAEGNNVDEVVPVRSVLDRVALLSVTANAESGPIGVLLPPAEKVPAWAGISPPRGGWSAASSIDTDVLEATAKAGIAEVAAAIPDGTGEQLVHRVRSEVWGRPIPGTSPQVPAGAAFAAVSLGFIRTSEPAAVFKSGTWTRVTTRRGHVLVHGR
jgi:hypothetical protein